jgi:hypothetical protein
MSAKKKSASESVDQLIAEIGRTRGRAALRSTLRDMLGQKGGERGAAYIVQDINRNLRILSQFGFKFSGTLGPELEFSQPDPPRDSVTLVPQSDGSVEWSHSSSAGKTYGKGLRSIHSLLVRRYGRINKKGIIYRRGKRTIFVGPSSLD